MLAMLGRLAWNELRQGWLVLLVGLAVPPMVYGTLRPGYTDRYLIMTFLLLAVIGAWGAVTAQRVRSGRSYAGMHFALHPAWPVLAAVVIQGLFMLLIGWGIGYNSPLAHLNVVHFIEDEMFTLNPISHATMTGMLAAGAIFLVGFIFSWTFSPLAGVSTAAIWLFGTEVSALGTISILGYGQAEQWNALAVEPALQHLRYLHYCLPAGLLAILLLLGPTKVTVRRRGLLACGLFLLVLMGYPIYHLAFDTNFRDSLYTRRNQDTIFRGGERVVVVTTIETKASKIYNIKPLISRDGTLALQTSPVHVNDKASELHFIDRRGGHEAVQRLAGSMRPVGFLDDRTALALHQRQHVHRTELLRWRITDNTLQKVASFPTQAARGVLIGNPWGQSLTGSISPDQRYAVVQVSSDIGQSTGLFDVWLVNLGTGNSILAIPAIQPEVGSVGWRKDCAILAGSGPALIVSLPDGRVSRNSAWKEAGR